MNNFLSKGLKTKECKVTNIQYTYISALQSIKLNYADSSMLLSIILQESWRQNTTLRCFYLLVVVIRQHASVSGMTYANTTSTKLLKCQSQTDPHHEAYITKRTRYNMRNNINKYNNACCVMGNMSKSTY